MVSVSIGHAPFPDDGDDLETLLKLADRRMYTDEPWNPDPKRPEALTRAHSKEIIPLASRARARQV